MIKNNLPELKRRKEKNEMRKLTFEVMARELKDGVTVSHNTLARLFSADGTFKRIDFDTLEALCRYFQCGVGDIFEYQEEPAAQ
jgi:putative transcriptional regulator